MVNEKRACFPTLFLSLPIIAKQTLPLLGLANNSLYLLPAFLFSATLDLL